MTMEPVLVRGSQFSVDPPGIKIDSKNDNNPNEYEYVN